MADEGVINVPSKYSVDESVRRLEEILKAKNVRIFALVEHSSEAEKVGLKMPPTKLLIFGNPKAGTPLMLASPSIAIDLPLKALAWQDKAGRVWLSYNDPEYLRARHGLPDELVANIAVIRGLVEQAAG